MTRRCLIYETLCLTNFLKIFLENEKYFNYLRIRPETVSSAKREHVSESSESEDERTIEERRNRVLSRRQQMQQFEKEEAPFEQEEPDDEVLLFVLLPLWNGAIARY